MGNKVVDLLRSTTFADSIDILPGCRIAVESPVKRKLLPAQVSDLLPFVANINNDFERRITQVGDLRQLVKTPAAVVYGFVPYL